MRRALGIVLVLGATACGNVEPLASTNAAIFAGTPAPDFAPVVGVVNFAGGQCSGSLIAPRLVLTARHCVANTDGQESQVVCGQTKFTPPDSAGAIFVVALPEISNDPKDYLGVAEIRMPDGLGDDLCGTDVVLLRLKEPLADITPLRPRVETPVAPGEIYSAVGFGVDESLPDRPASERKRGEGYEVTCSGPGCKASDILGNEWMGDGGPCSGDSGGPALDADGQLIGVVSRGKSGCQEPVFSDVASRAAWLKSEAITTANAAGEAPPAWAPCDAENPCSQGVSSAPEAPPNAPAPSCVLSHPRGHDGYRLSSALFAALWLLRRRRNAHAVVEAGVSRVSQHKSK